MCLNFKVDEEKCIHCGLCIKDCMVKVLTFNEEKNCIKCQHCLAVCPTGAISILGREAENSDIVDANFNPDEIFRLIKERRSIRHYREYNVEKEKMEKLKEMLSFVPTGVNNHSLHFTIIENKTIMDEFRQKVNELIVKIIRNKAVKSLSRRFANYAIPILRGEDVIFRGAPHMIIVSVSKNAPCKDIDPIIALSYFELYAKSLGIGTCWCGLAYYCLKYIPHLKDMFDIPKTHKVAYTMLFGYPKVVYKRTTQPKQVPINSVDKLKSYKVGLLERFFSKFGKEK